MICRKIFPLIFILVFGISMSVQAEDEIVSEDIGAEENAEISLREADMDRVVEEEMSANEQKLEQESDEESTERTGAWVQSRGKWWYRYVDGSYPANEICVIDNVRYGFDSEGWMVEDWFKLEDKWYYFNYGKGNMYYGWLLKDGVWYYLDPADSECPGLMEENINDKVIDGSEYCFNASGAMLTGWQKRPEGWYYYDSSGAKAYGWRNVDGLWYYMDKDNTQYSGVMAENINDKLIDGSEYCFNASGAMLTGWQKRPEGWYYYDSSGAKAYGWKYVHGAWYFLDKGNERYPGLMLTGWNTIDEQWYYLDASGAMATGWILLNGEWYYLSADGSMCTGWQRFGDIWYYLYEENEGGTWGSMAKNTTVEGYRIGLSGKWSHAHEEAARVLDSIGWNNLPGAYNWSAGLRYYRMNSSPAPGCEWFANYGFQNGMGNCYVMAATFYCMADLMGYDVHMMAGYVPRRGGGVTPHSWCELVLGGTVYVFDPNFTNETGRNGYQIRYGTSGTWVYSSYYRMN